MEYRNPIIRGFYPDPSICRDGDSYYLVNSTFQYYPGVMLFSSKDMVNWEPLGGILTRKKQLKLNDTGTRGGIYAPTLRLHHGRFYMVVSNVTYGGNFYVYADDIRGPWSDPIYVDQGGIDPTIFFDDDGTVYFISTGMGEGGKQCIEICEIDIETGRKLTDSVPLWYGTGGKYVEGPHFYKINGWYYLLCAEGGTEYGHMVTYCRSRSPRGPFEHFPGNPALTMRNAQTSQIQGSGHGDLMQDKNGNWWFVHLAFRMLPGSGQYHHLGRETCLVPVTWKDDWFYIGDGTVHEYYELPDIEAAPQARSFEMTFENTDQFLDYAFIHYMDKRRYRFDKDRLVMTGSTATPFIQSDDPVFAGIRQSEMEEDLGVDLRTEAEEAGITMYMDAEHHYDLYVENGKTASLRLSIGPVSQVMKTVEVEGIPENGIRLHVHADGDSYTFDIETDDGRIPMGCASPAYLSSEVAGGFTGVMFGMYVIDAGGAEAEFTDLCLKHEAQETA